MERRIAQIAGGVLALMTIESFAETILYRPSPEHPPRLTYSEAQTTWRDCALNRARNRLVNDIQFEDNGFIFLFSNGNKRKLLYKDVTNPRIAQQGLFDRFDSGLVLIAGPTDIGVSHFGNALLERVKDCADALFILVHGIPVDDLTEFEATAKSYREAAPKPMLPDHSVKLRVSAESALLNKQYSDAVNLYSQILAISPWWPEGHFNRALALAELKSYTLAAVEMKRYTMLVPNAPDIRAAKDKIYEWEILADR